MLVAMSRKLVKNKCMNKLINEIETIRVNKNMLTMMIEKSDYFDVLVCAQICSVKYADKRALFMLTAHPHFRIAYMSKFF